MSNYVRDARVQTLSLYTFLATTALLLIRASGFPL